MDYNEEREELTKPKLQKLRPVLLHVQKITGHHFGVHVNVILMGLAVFLVATPLALMGGRF